MPSSVSNSASNSPPPRPRRNLSPRNSPSPARSPPKQQELPPKVFVGNLTLDTTKNDLENAFGQYGSITDCFKPNQKAFGFVTFSSSEEMRNAIDGMNGKQINGQEIRCNQAKPRPKGCFKCKKEGHMARDCPEAGQENNGGRSQSRGGKGCFNCGQQGHFSRQCPNPKKQGNRGGNPRNNRKRQASNQGSPPRKNYARRSVSRSTSQPKRKHHKRGSSSSSSSVGQKRRSRRRHNSSSSSDRSERRHNRRERSRSAQVKRSGRRRRVSSSRSISR